MFDETIKKNITIGEDEKNIDNKHLEKCIKISIPYIYNSAIYSVYYENATPKWRIGTLYNCGWKNIIIMMVVLDYLKLRNLGEKFFLPLLNLI